MSIIYIGKGIDTLHLQPGATFGVSEEGLDTLEEVYSGPKPALPGWMARYGQKGLQHPIHRSLYLTTISQSEGRSFAEVSVGWIGRKNGADQRNQDPRISKRTSIKTASFKTDSPEPATREVSYVAPEIVFSYATEKEVILPQFQIDSKTTRMAGLSSKDETAFKILQSVITTDAGERYIGYAPAPFVAALFRAPMWIYSGMESEKIPHTPYFRNQEVWGFEFPQDT